MFKASLILKAVLNKKFIKVAFLTAISLLVHLLEHSSIRSLISSGFRLLYLGLLTSKALTLSTDKPKEFKKVLVLLICVFTDEGLTLTILSDSEVL